MAAKKYRLASGEAVPSVTTVLKNLGWGTQPLMFWAFKQGQENPDAVSLYQIDEAARVGTLAHRMIESDILGHERPAIPDELRDQVEQAFESYLRWKRDSGFELLFAEERCVSERYKYGGTLDCIARIGGRVALFDWKTSKDAYKEYLVQLSAYRNLWDEAHPRMKIEEVHLLRIGKDDTQWAHHFWINTDTAFEVFLCALQLHSLEKKLRI